MSCSKILLILDLDETLIHASLKPLLIPADFEIFGYSIYKRPHLDYFLLNCYNFFELAIWSSASDEYVEEIVAQILPKEVSFSFIWGRSRCTYKRNLFRDERRYYGDNDERFYVKNLKKLKQKGYHLDKILIVDDTPRKAMLNYGNAIYPAPFEGESSDQELLLLYKYLIKIKDKDKLRRLEKRNWRAEVCLTD